MSNGHGDMDNEETQREREEQKWRERRRGSEYEGMKDNMSSLSISPPRD